jgi:hypothetical protein
VCFQKDKKHAVFYNLNAYGWMHKVTQADSNPSPNVFLENFKKQGQGITEDFELEETRWLLINTKTQLVSFFIKHRK